MTTRKIGKTTAEMVAEIEAGLRARGLEPDHHERWEGDGVVLVHVRAETEGSSSRNASVSGDDGLYDSGITLSNGMGGDTERHDAAIGDAIGWLAGDPGEGPARPDTIPGHANRR